MKVHELIKHLQEFPNQDAEVMVQYLITAKKSDKVIPGLVKATELLVDLKGTRDCAYISTAVIEEEI
ncbi:hypothetical protein [Bacillus pretiosus]|uniref:hypothetical protein n=1 Tax=Bacillus pretiosus TaxID=2983392 RepID=UPI003D64A2C5